LLAAAPFCYGAPRELPVFVPGVLRRKGAAFPGVAAQLKTSLAGTAPGATATLASGQLSSTSVQVPSGDNFPSAQPSGSAGGEMVYSRIFWKTRFHFFA
jgi:hypothetical protein